MTKISADLFPELLLAGTPLLDVRAPVEFAQGHLPQAVNLPLLNDDERAIVGTTYKVHGQEAAIRKGHELISGPVKAARLQAWQEQIRQFPSTVIYCFRGGLRSQITQQWLKEAGIERPLLVGGYKKARQFLRDETLKFSQTHSLVLISGPTGSGKTSLLQSLAETRAVIDLEALAQHRGSAFGSRGSSPRQAQFENELALSLLKASRKIATSGEPILVEDESRLIGRCAIPETFFELLRASPVVWVEEDLGHRVENIFREYILETALGTPVSAGESGAEQVLARYKQSLLSIRRKLGGLRYAEVLGDFEKAEVEFRENRGLDAHRVWIEKLLVSYYDPIYLGSLARRHVKILFRGAKNDCHEFLLRHHA